MCRTFYKIGILEQLKIKKNSSSYMNQILYFLRLFKYIKNTEEKDRDR